MENNRKVLYSGIQPTGKITIGNYIGAVKNWIKFQDEFDCIYEIADLHSLTVKQDPAEFRKRTYGFLAQYLAMGLSPEKSIVYLQSTLPEHTMLMWPLNCITYVGECSRMTQFKEKSAKHADNINMGLMDYPVLMAADILLFQTDLVPVGEDQKQHLEITRDLAIRFNNRYGETFRLPQAYIPKFGARIKSLQQPDKKMSKSDENENATVSVLDDPDTIMRKFKRAVTDSDTVIRLSDDKPGVSNLLNIYAAFQDITPQEAEKIFADKNYAALKIETAQSVIETLKPIQTEYAKLIADKAYLDEVIRTGAERAGKRAYKTVKKVYKKIGLIV